MYSSPDSSALASSSLAEEEKIIFLAVALLAAILACCLVTGGFYCIMRPDDYHEWFTNNQKLAKPPVNPTINGGTFSPKMIVIGGNGPELETRDNLRASPV